MKMSREIAYRAAFGARLQVLRKKTGLTQAEFAAKVGLVQPSIVRYEAGKQLPNAFIIMKIAQEYKCDLGWLIFGDETKT